MTSKPIVKAGQGLQNNPEIVNSETHMITIKAWGLIPNGSETGTDESSESCRIT